MITSEPNVDPKGKYGLTEAAKVLGISRTTLNRAANSQDKMRAIPYSIRRSTGRRVFLGQDLINYWRLTY